MKKTLLILAAILVVGSCSIFKKTPQPENRIEYTYKDSTVVKDSVRIVDLPVERIVDIVPVYDTLDMETSLAKAKAYIDLNTHMLRGEMWNKPQVKIKVEYRERYVYRDSIETKEVPVPYEVVVEKTKYPALFWILLVLAVVYLGAKVPKLVKTANWLTKFDWKKLMFWKKKNKE